jgi:putative colanic acid biosynthesis UDP-glucose lipid carrier transferase
MSSLDEFPQFINVFLGDMSVIGPRPHAINLNKEYNDIILDFNKRHKFKPGITGLAQSMGFNGLIYNVHDMKSRVKLDIFYFKNWSLFLDIKITIMTIVILIKYPLNSLFK